MDGFIDGYVLSCAGSTSSAYECQFALNDSDISGLSSRQVAVLRMGTVEYRAAWQLQQALAEALAQGRGRNSLILLQHPHTFTVGRSGRPEHLGADPANLEAAGAAVFWVDRGGSITYHGPGQLVAYPILQRAFWGDSALGYIRRLEEVLVGVLADFGIESSVYRERPGVWVGSDKIAAVGVRLSRGITSHGFALNVNTDLSWFQRIIPCGLIDAGVTSMEYILRRPVPISEVTDRIIHYFGSLFHVGMVPGDAEQWKGISP